MFIPRLIESPINQEKHQKVLVPPLNLIYPKLSVPLLSKNLTDGNIVTVLLPRRVTQLIEKVWYLRQVVSRRVS